MLLKSERSSKDKLLPSRGYGRKENLYWKTKVEKKEIITAVYLCISTFCIYLHLYIHTHVLYQKIDIHFEVSFLKRIALTVLGKFIIKDRKLFKNDVKRNFLAKKNSFL